jgi:hypothetical protein
MKHSILKTMKKSTLQICLTVVFCCCNLLGFSQDVNNIKFNPDNPVFFTPKSHDPNFLKSGKLSEKSFYQSKSEWQHIIDTTWGPGAPLAEKLKIFNTYAKVIHDESDVLCFLNMNWDSLYNHYLSQITESTSKGAFSVIMSHFAYDLKDGHTLAFDTTVVVSALNPGVPLLMIGSFIGVEHFGAVTTVLPDSTTLVLRVVPNHPLNIVPGDIILGYEGIPWRNLVRELLDGGLPMIAGTGGCKSADTYNNLMGVGLNWHLFSTIDILKYSTGDTVHLSVLPMLNLNVPPMVNNEQMAIQNIPFPHILPPPLEPADTVVTYGILNNTNIGYIFLAQEPILTDNDDVQFYNAVNALKNTEALIIDIRYNAGGRAFFEKAFNLLFNEFQRTLEHSYRCNTNTFELCPSGNWANWQINGKDPDYYDRPIAVLLGPNCGSMGDITAQQFRYHPMVKFFGASSHAALGWGLSINNIADWYLMYSGGDMFHTSEPGVYLNRREFPIDYPVWFNKDDVAKGKDPIVEKSLEWINNLAYGHDINKEQRGNSSFNDTVKIDAFVENPNSHQLSSRLIFESFDGLLVDSTEMTQINLPNGNNWQGKWITKGLPENNYWVSLKVSDHNEGTSFNNKHMTRVTNRPVDIGKLSYTELSTNQYTIKTELKNSGETMTVYSSIIKLTSENPWVKSISPEQVSFSGLKPRDIRKIPNFTVLVDEATFQGYVNLTYTITEDGWTYWVIDTTLVDTLYNGIEPFSLPMAFNLEQNYPNPFNSVTTINWQIAQNSKVTLKVLDIVGRTVATLVDEQRPQGKYETQFNAATLPKGIYFYQLKAGEFSQTRKMILLK